MDIKDIQNLIKFVAKSGANEVKLEMEDVKITIKTGSEESTTIVQQMPAVAPAAKLSTPTESLLSNGWFDINGKAAIPRS